MKINKEEWSTLIPEIKEWNHGKGINPDDWISCVGETEHFIGFSTLFWPEFVLFRECIFIDDMNEKTFEEWFKHCKGNLKKIECTINHRHITDMIGAKKESTKEQIVFIGHLLREIWETKLRRDFRDRKTIVEFVESKDDDLSGYQLIVYQDR